MDMTLSAMRLANMVTMNVRIRRLREWRVRAWLGVRLIHLAVWIMGMAVEVELA